MKVLLVGSGAREHAIAWKLQQSARLTELFLWPASPAMLNCGTPFGLSGDVRLEELVLEAKNKGVDFVVVGPEQPLSEGIADICRAQALPCFGPTQAAAQLEASKAFAKELMAAARIPTAASVTVQGEEACRNAASELLQRTGGAVIKASGLASGKGVFVCSCLDEIDDALIRLYRSGMAKAAETVVVEEVLYGRECSFFVFLGQGEPISLGFAVDHKRLRDGDLGPNTGGMGCYTPVPWLPEHAAATVMTRVVYPLLDELQRRSLDYTGCLYVGLMWGEHGPAVVEFNVRLGDPEAEVLALQDRRDWVELIATQLGLLELSPGTLLYPQSEGASVAVVLASPCYPYGEGATEQFTVPLELFKNQEKGFCAFGAALKQEGQDIRTSKGRVLTLVAHGEDFSKARERVYREIHLLTDAWTGIQYRQDIAASLGR